MAKTFLKILITILFLVVFLFGYFSLVGFETKRFNTHIKANLKKINNNFDVKLNDVKIILDLFNLKIKAKTLGPVISYNDRLIDIELIKSDISLTNFFKEEFSLSNLFISTKSVKLKDLVSFLRSVRNENKAELFIIENFIDKGYLIADITLNFDDKGKVKDDLKINGFVKDASINFLNKGKIEKINFIFETKNKTLDIDNLKFLYEKVNFSSKRIKLENKDNNLNIEGEVENDEVILSDQLLKNFFKPLLDIDFEKLKFSSKNIFSIKINDSYKIIDYGIKSSISINELIIENNIDIQNIFPNFKSQIKLSNHQTEIIYKNDNLSINGNGSFLIQENYDKIYYKIEKVEDYHLFKIQYDFINNPIKLNFLNYKINDQSEVSLKLDGKINNDKSLNFEKIELKNSYDSIIIDDLVLTNDFKISKIKSAKFNFTDSQNKKNVFQIKDNKKNYLIFGKTFNASKFIDDMIFEDSKSKDIFAKDYDIEIDLKEVFLHNDHITYNLKGRLSSKDNNVINANITSQFNKNEKMSFTIIRKNNQRVTTFFSDQAKPFVQKFNFIKGFNNGSLDFYSIKSKDISNSKLKIYNFKLKELPALTKILTLASLQGIADLLSGEGIGFSEFEMNFENKNKLMTINEIYAIGPAISILMEGYIEKSKLISLRGTLVPATTINKAIGSIPIIGNILVGKKTGEGVFGVSFKIKGPPKKLETSVNPIKTLTPRFITRTLEKIKKN